MHRLNPYLIPDLKVHVSETPGKERKTFLRKRRVISVMVVDKDPVCATCGKTSDCMMTCFRCYLERYCSRTCQLKHWKNHQAICIDFVARMQFISILDCIKDEDEYDISMRKIDGEISTLHFKSNDRFVIFGEYKAEDRDVIQASVRICMRIPDAEVWVVECLWSSFTEILQKVQLLIPGVTVYDENGGKIELPPLPIVRRRKSFTISMGPRSPDSYSRMIIVGTDWKIHGHVVPNGLLNKGYRELYDHTDSIVHGIYGGAVYHLIFPAMLDF